MSRQRVQLVAGGEMNAGQLVDDIAQRVMGAVRTIYPLRQKYSKARGILASCFKH
jgi:hypothetical protein